MLKNQILTAEKASDLFGSTVDESELLIYAENLKNLFAASDPQRVEAVEKIDKLLLQRNFDIARVIEGGVKVRKSPYKILKKDKVLDSVVTHHAADKRGEPRRFFFAANPAANPVIMQSNDNINRIRESVTKRNRINFPEVVDTFFLKAKNGHKLLASIHNQGSGKTLAETSHISRTDEEIAFLFQEMLETLRKTHEAGVIHGACFLDSWVYDEKLQKLILTDWKYSVLTGEQTWKFPESIVEKELYLSKILISLTPNKEVDIRLAAYAAYSLTDSNNSPWIRKYLKSMGDYPFDSAKQILKEFTDTFKNKQLGIEEDISLEG